MERGNGVAKRWQEPRWDAIPWRRLSLYRILLCRTPCRSLAAIHQIVKGQSLKVRRGRGCGALTHRTMRVRRWTLKECQRSGGVKEDEIQPVNQREDLAAFGTLHTCQRVRSVGASDRKEGKRTSGRELAAPPRRAAGRRKVRSHTHTQAWHAIRKPCCTILHALY